MQKISHGFLFNGKPKNTKRKEAKQRPMVTLEQFKEGIRKRAEFNRQVKKDVILSKKELAQIEADNKLELL